MDLKKKRYILMFFMGMLYSSQNVMPWFSTYYYKAMQGALGYTDGQLGNMITAFGVVAILMYIIAGILSDRFSIKMLLLISSFGTGGLILLMSTLPSYPVMLMIQMGFAVTVVCTFYGAFVKFTRTMGTMDEQGRMYGYQFAFNGFLGMVSGFVASGIYASLVGVGDITSFRYMLYLYAGFNIIPGIVLLFFYNDKKDTYETEEDSNSKFQFKYVKEVIKRPEVWLIAIMGCCSYTFKCSASYFTPYLTDSFAVPVVYMNFVAIFRSYVVRILMNPISGIAIDKMKSATKVMLFVFVLGIAIVFGTIILPANPNLAIIAVILMLLIAASYNLSVPCWYTPLNEAKLPAKYYGTACGIVSAVAFSPDAFFYLIGGSFLDNFGESGYNYIYYLVLGIVVFGLVITMFLRKRIRKNEEKVVLLLEN